MKKVPDQSESEREGVGEDRAERANAAMCEVCDESGMKVSTWEKFQGWREYVEGRTSESQLAAKAQSEVNDFSKAFGKYLVIEKEDPTDSRASDRMERVRQANRIYRKVCEENAMKLCFFSNFSAWSDYVEGRIEDAEFTRRARLELEKMTTGVGLP